MKQTKSKDDNTSVEKPRRKSSRSSDSTTKTMKMDEIKNLSEETKAAVVSVFLKLDKAISQDISQVSR